MLRVQGSTNIASSNISIALSEVLEEVGVTDRIINMRRNTYIIREKLATYYNIMKEKRESFYFFGSQSEGSTTQGLSSDLDCLLCIQHVNIVQRLKELKDGMINFLLVQDEMTSPGYCFLQVIKKDDAEPQMDVPDNFTFVDDKGRILVKNSFLYPRVKSGQIRHGPALMSKGKADIETDDEVVYAFQCETWPQESNGWTSNLESDSWPYGELVRHSENSGFFVVPVGSKLGQYKDLEWRISTSKAERHLMFSLNVTQIQCYVLLKMIIKTFINPVFEESISSFICKTVLFHSINRTSSDMWQKDRLIECLAYCLHKLNGYIISGTCPHFISHRNNLLAGRYSIKTKLDLMEVFQRLLSSVERTLLSIPIDDIGIKLEAKLHVLERRLISDISPTRAHFLIAGTLFQRTGSFVCLMSNMIDMDLEEIADNSTEVVRVLFTFIRHVRNIQAEEASDTNAAECLNATLHSRLWFSLTILNKDKNVGVSNKDLFHLSLTYTTDIASSQLKFASFLYTEGEFQLAAQILDKVKSNYDFKSVETVCGCIKRNSSPSTVKQWFMEKAFEQNEHNIIDILKTRFSFCVRFISKEECAVPLELQFEMYKLIYENMSKLRKDINFNKDMIRVDSLSFLFFLQYKIYGRQRQRAEQEVALYNLEQTIEREDNLGHRETALNLLGQCLEEECRLTDALHCYWRSLKICPENNASKVLICCCFAKLHRLAAVKY